jgi:hypothetical protein
MAEVIIPRRLTSLRQIDKIDLETIFASFVKVIGGAYFVNGSAGPSMSYGFLDSRNFSSSAGITNQYKTAPNSVSCIQITDPRPSIDTNVTYTTPLPFSIPGVGVNPRLSIPTIIGWSLIFSGTQTGNTDVTATLRYVRSGTTTQIDTVTNASYAVNSTLRNNGSLNVPLRIGDFLELAITHNSGGPTAINGMFCGVWVKSLHGK